MVRLTDRTIAELLRAARRLHGSDDLAGAERHYLAMREIEPEQPDALHGLGVIALVRGNAAVAVGLIGKALRARPQEAAFYASMAEALLAENHAEAARAAASLACLHAPELAPAHALHGAALARLGDLQAAETAFDRALAIDPRSLPARDGRARLMLASGRAETALQDFSAVAERLSQDAAAIANVGAALHELRREAEAEAAFDRALSLAPGTPASLSMRGLVRLADGRVGEAIEDLAAAHVAAPADAAVARNLAAGLYEAERHEEARALLDAVLEANPTDRDARFSRACIDLAAGCWATGWAGYEARAGREVPGRPAWDGAPIAGRLLLVAEQGLGDTLMFLRYLAPARALASGGIVLALPATLHRLASGLGCEVLDLADAASVEAAAAARLGSLPFLLALDAIPPPARLAAAPPDRSAAMPRIGLAWAGSPLYRQDRRRSIAPALLAPLLGVARVEFVSLQAEQRADDPPGLRYPAQPADFADTARTIAGLDLVVTVDTAVAHLSGSLGVATWLLDRAGGDWRWLRGRDDSPWYPSLRIFRAAAPDPPELAWPDVVRRAAAELAASKSALPRRTTGPVRNGAI